MSKFACPDKSLVPLSPNGFQLTIDKLPNISLFSQKVMIPSVTLPTSTQNNPFVQINQPGDYMEFEPLVVQFLVDNKMENYIEIFNWLKGLGFPNSNEEYTEFIQSQSSLLSESERAFSDGTLIIYNNLLQPVRRFKFYDMVPVSLSGIEFETSSNDVNYLTGTVTLEYTRYDIID